MINILTSFKPFLNVLCVFGIFPLSHKDFPEKEGNKFSSLGIFFSTCHFSVIILLLYLNVLNDIAWTSTSTILSCAWNYISTYSNLFILFMFFYQICKLNSIKKLFFILKKFDELVRQII